MTTKTRARKVKTNKTKGTSRVTWVWGDPEKGITVVRSARKEGGKYWWDVHHVKDGKVAHVSRDHSTKAAAMREAKGYAQYAQKHPRITTFFGK